MSTKMMVRFMVMVLKMLQNIEFYLAKQTYSHRDSDEITTVISEEEIEQFEKDYLHE